jgi:enoyl-CoA hydratase
MTPADSTDELVHYRVERSIATITLDSPANRNALSVRLVDELVAHLSLVQSDATVRAVVLTHTGGTFGAGADLREQSEPGGPARGTHRLLVLLRTILELDRPVLAQVDGHVRAGGIGVIGACDLVVAGPAATFALTEVRLGLAPAIISLTTQGRFTERAFARYSLTGEVFGPDAAAAGGLVTVATDDAATEVLTRCDALRQCSPQGLAETKRLSAAPTLARLDADAAQLQAVSERLFESEEAAEGMRSFLERRPPRWTSTS